MKLDKKIETLDYTATYRKVCLSFATRIREGFVLSGVCMKSLFIISLLLVLSCKEEVDMPVVPQSNNSHQWVKPDTTEDAFVLGNFRAGRDLSGYSVTSTTNIYANRGVVSGGYYTHGQKYVVNELGQMTVVNGRIATEGTVLAGDGNSFTPTKGYAKISFGGSDRRTFNRVRINCQELIINGARTGLYVLKPD